jgi:Secretory lipase
MWQLLFRLWFVLVIAGIAAPASAANFYDATAREIAMPPGTLLRYDAAPLPGLVRARAYRMLYASRDFANRPIAASGIAVISTVSSAQGKPQHIVAWAHPTVGTSCNCAPSFRQQPAHFISGLNLLIAAGHVVTATDYPGLGTPGPIGYLVGAGQARAVLDSVRAAAQLHGYRFSPDYAVYGFSQGAHAALFAGREAASYMPEFRLKGVAAIAPPTNLLALFAADADSIEGKVLFSYTLKSWAAKYGLALGDVLSRTALPVVAKINSICIDDFSGALATLSAQGEFGDTIFTGNPLAHPLWRKRLIENSISSLPTNVPFFIVQGGIDSVVRPAVTLQTMRTTCSNGGSVKFLYLKDKGHSGSSRAAFPAVTKWLSSVLAGQSPGTSCK